MTSGRGSLAARYPTKEATPSRQWPGLVDQANSFGRELVLPRALAARLFRQRRRAAGIAVDLLPFAEPGRVRLFLQDLDEAGGSTESTSVLTFAADRGRLKTRICADWAESRGFRSRIVERRFGSDLRVASDEPLLALCGVDNPQARAILEGAGFATVFEAGLGAGADDFRLIRTHSFPAPLGAAQVWAEDIGAEPAAPDVLPPAYGDLTRSGVSDQCCLTRLAEVAAGAPFVGMSVRCEIVDYDRRQRAAGTDTRRERARPSS